MIDVNVEYSEYIKKASDMLYLLFEGQKKTHSEVLAQAETLLPIVTGIPGIRSNPYYSEILTAVVDHYEIEVGIKTYAPDTIAKDRQSRYWLSRIKPTILHPYFDRYKQYLRADGFEMKAIENIEKTCEEILSYCANPRNIGGREKKRGLVVGDVQSGKTANYLGLINMAFDYGYKIVVLLAGTTNSLRLQTQKRTDSGVIGAKSDSIGNSIEYIGVGINAEDHFAIPFTNQTNDFAKFIQKNLNIGIGDFNKPVVLVVKKVKGILESVSERLQSALSEKGVKDSSSILIIDDEADNASVNTRSLDNPTTINKAIRAIFNKFPIASYVGYTATPFANVFIYPRSDDNNLDLFPSDFIVQLHAPDTYFGGRKVFPKGEDVLPRCLVLLSEDEGNFLPVVHDKHYDYLAMAESLKQAIREFLINNVIRTIRGQATKHRSMMINITRYNDVQEKIRYRVEEYLSHLTYAIEQLSEYSLEKFIENTECNALYCLYQSNFYDEIRRGDEDKGIPPIAWKQIQSGLYTEIKKFIVAVINSRNGKMTQHKSGENTRFDYEEYKETGARVIAIGGMVLSRGLTLEGLMTSYYSRNAGTYDTLLQMCRWFGYRPKYEDLCRIYLTQESIDRFDAVLDAVEDLKAQFTEMKRQDKKPEDFGLMIKQSPDTLETSLLITARNKMRGTETVEYYLNYGGVYADTSKLLKSIGDNNHNMEAVKKFLSKVQFGWYGERWYMASAVSKFDVAELIANLRIPYVNRKFDTEGLSEYINNSDIFMYWDVVVATGESKNHYMQDCFGIKGVTAALRSFHSNGEDDRYIRIGGSNNRVLDPGIFDAGLNLTPEQRKLILRRQDKPVESELTARDYLQVRENPILVIYPIDLNTELTPSQKNDTLLNDEKKTALQMLKRQIKTDVGNDTTPLVAFAFGFPQKESKTRLKYRANIIKLDEMNRGLETDDDGEGEGDTDD